MVVIASIGLAGLALPALAAETEIVGRLNKEVNAGLADPSIKARIGDLGYSAFASSHAEFAKFVADYTDEWAKVIRAAGIKAE